jgi:deazaflavin-dependent oxidoreductase (nitroreductase family)
MSALLHRPNVLQRLVLRLAASRPGSALLSRILHPLDRLFSGLTGGRRTLTELVTGLPIIELTTHGARSGLPRTCPLIAIPVETGLAVIASNFGARKHPSWYYNLRANPEVLVGLGGGQERRFARPVNGVLRDSIWNQAVALYPGYRAYRSQAAGREIPVIVLETPS